MAIEEEASGISRRSQDLTINPLEFILRWGKVDRCHKRARGWLVSIFSRTNVLERSGDDIRVALGSGAACWKSGRQDTTRRSLDPEWNSGPNRQPESLHHAMVSLDTVQSRKTIQMHDAKNEIQFVSLCLEERRAFGRENKTCFPNSKHALRIN
jgi:hypothetical protein